MADIIDFNDAPRQYEPGSKDETRVLLLKSLLNQNSASFVRWLFPAAAIKNGEARIGNVDGMPGGSLQIGLTGEKTGVWFDHQGGSYKGGDFIGLYAAAEGLSLRTDFPKILEELEAWAGISKKAPTRSPKQAVRESHKDKPNPHAEPLPPPSASWHYLDENSDIIATVYRYDLENGGKTFRPWDAKTGRNKPPEIRPLYNLPGILHAEPIIIVEGEKCADALIGLGFNATTAMGGAHAPADKTDWDAVKGKQVVLWPDNDKSGTTWLRTVTKTLETFDCKVTAVKIPPGKRDKWDVANAVEEGLDAAAMVREALSSGEDPGRCYRPLSIRQLAALTPPEWMIDNYLPNFGLACIYGPSGTFKSFITLDMALHIAHGMPWCGKTTQQRGILYIAGEGAFGIYKRIKAWHQSHALDYPDNFHVLTSPVNLVDQKADLDQFLKDMECLRSHNLGFIIVDTLARAFAGADENATKDMNTFIGNCDRIRDHFQCLVMPVHHSGKDEDKGARGSSSLRGAVDTELHVKRMGTSRRVNITCRKQKEAEEAPIISMDAVDIEIVMEDGELIKCAVMRPLTNPIRDKAYLGPIEKAVLEALEDETDGMTASGLVRKTNKRKSSVYDALKSLGTVQMIRKEDGLYFAAGQSVEKEQG